MPRRPIRIKLMVGLCLVLGMMLTLLGGSIFGLKSFHDSNLTLVDQLHELGWSKDLFERVVRLKVPQDESPEALDAFRARAREARGTLLAYFKELLKNTTSGNRGGDSRGAAVLAFSIDADLTQILAELEPTGAVSHALPGTVNYLEQHPEIAESFAPKAGVREDLEARIGRLNKVVMQLPDRLHRDFYTVLLASQKQYATSRVIVWTSAVAVFAMLIGLTGLARQWVLRPVRLLERGVRSVSRGVFNHRIELNSGDEMQALAEAFNDMTSKLGSMYSDLERQVEERSRQLVRSERLAGVGFLAAGVAHEINNPLASIAFCSEALENRLKEKLGRFDESESKVIRQYMRMIQEESFRCKNITERLLDYSRRGDIERERTDIGGLIQGVVEMIRHIGKYRNKPIVFQPREVVFAHVDAQEIKQVVLNLAVNALESMESEGTLRIDLKADEGMARVTFKDDGCGMTPEVLENVFEPFFTRRKGGKGTGLGLSITHQIISRHHGSITAESPGENLGSTFTIRLPLFDPATLEASASGSRNPKAA